jgi:hypothetical protein
VAEGADHTGVRFEATRLAATARTLTAPQVREHVPLPRPCPSPAQERHARKGHETPTDPPGKPGAHAAAGAADLGPSDATARRRQHSNLDPVEHRDPNLAPGLKVEYHTQVAGSFRSMTLLVIFDNAGIGVPRTSPRAEYRRGGRPDCSAALQPQARRSRRFGVVAGQHDCAVVGGAPSDRCWQACVVCELAQLGRASGRRWQCVALATRGAALSRLGRGCVGAGQQNGAEDPSFAATFWRVG